MSDILSLGPIDLSEWELPPSLTFGGDQQTKVHKLVGGARVVDVMGRDDHDLTWSGIIRSDGYTDALARAELIDEIRLRGQTVPLTWQGRTRRVVVSSFTYTYENSGAYVPYSIKCIVVTIDAGIAWSPPSATAIALADLATVQLLADLPLSATLAFGLAVSVLPDVGSLIIGTAAYGIAATAISAALDVCDVVQTAADTALDAIGTVAESAGLIFGGAAGVIAASVAMDAVADATSAVAYVGRAAAAFT